MTRRTMNLYCEETWVNATHNHRIGESGVYETYTDNLGELYRYAQRQYGRCISRIYINSIDKPGTSRAIGWVFIKRMKYEDCEETYLQETWVTVHEKPDTVIRQRHYLTI